MEGDNGWSRDCAMRVPGTLAHHFVFTRPVFGSPFQFSDWEEAAIDHDNQRYQKATEQAKIRDHKQLLGQSRSKHRHSQAREKQQLEASTDQLRFPSQPGELLAVDSG